MKTYDYRKVCKDAADALDRETRQGFLDKLWAGMTLGDARKEAGISFDAAMGITTDNIEQLHVLRREVRP